jgi:hypothetical protein
VEKRPSSTGNGIAACERWGDHVFQGRIANPAGEIAAIVRNAPFSGPRLRHWLHGRTKPGITLTIGRA